MMEYKAIIHKDDVTHLSKRNLKNVTYDQAQLSFHTDEKNLKELMHKIDDIRYYNVLKTRIKLLLQKYLISIISVIIIMLLLINQHISVQEIRFINYDTYDVEVENFIQKYLKKVGPFYYLNTSLNTINHDLQNHFYDYEWIGLNKKGAVLEVKIKKQGEQDYHYIDDGIVGDYIASKDAIVKMYYVKKGVVLVKELQSVSKGDILITGNLKYLIGGEEYIKPNGLVIGETLEYHNIKVKKHEEKTIKTGKLTVKKHFIFFNIKSKDKIPYHDYIKETTSTFKLGSFLKYQIDYYYEVNTVSINYTYEEALQYAKTKIEKDFQKTTKYEMIKFIDLVADEETEEYFMFRFIVKKHENIASFVPKNIQ